MMFKSATLMLALAAMSASSTDAFAFQPNSRLPATFERTFDSSMSSTTSTTELNMGLRSFFSGKATKSKAGADISNDEVRALFSLWNNALATGDSRIVASRYAKEAVLLPTVSDIPRTDKASITNYFDSFLLKKPQGVITDGNIRIGDGWAQDTG
jgi:hypothetical protein